MKSKNETIKFMPWQQLSFHQIESGDPTNQLREQIADAQKEVIQLDVEARFVGERH